MLKSIKKFYLTYSDHTLFIIVCFILFFPLALYLMWRHKLWTSKVRGIVTLFALSFTALFGVIGYNAPPYISLLDESILSNYKTDNDSVGIHGQVSTLHNTKVQINGKSIDLDKGGNFNYNLPLAEGNTSIRLEAKSDKGLEFKQFKVYRTTSAELKERKIQAEKLASEKKRIAAEEAANKKKIAETHILKAKQNKINSMPVCNGKNIKSSCKSEGMIYKTYVYYSAIAEKSHTVKEITYRDEVKGYCTLCNDGTYSPSCATGRGACSHHGGVSQWNAPRISKVPVSVDKIIVDAPAVAERYEKVLDPAYN